MPHISANKNTRADGLAGTRIDASCGVKTCTACGSLKPLGMFPFARAGIGFAASWCKDCRATYGRERRIRKLETDVIFRVNRAILKRQAYGTDVCLLAEKVAYQAAAHLLDDLGMLTVEGGHTFRSVFRNSLPGKTKRLRTTTAALFRNDPELARLFGLAE